MHSVNPLEGNYTGFEAAYFFTLTYSEDFRKTGFISACCLAFLEAREEIPNFAKKEFLLGFF